MATPTPPVPPVPPAPPTVKPDKPRRLANINNNDVVGRWRVTAPFLKKATELSQRTRYPKLAAFLPENWIWITDYLKSVFHGKYKPFPVYPPGASGIYGLKAANGGQAIKIAIAGDWGTGTIESRAVARSMLHDQPDYTVHLGDIYYMGKEEEIRANCLGKHANGFTGVKWPHGSEGTLVLNGNHEMYSGGAGFFTVFMKTAWMGNPANKQLTSYFCLEAPCWRILCLDTGYNSVGLPILGAMPLLNKLSFVGANARLEDPQIAWLRTLDLQKNIKPTLVLSHHQYFSAFPEDDYTVPAKQLSEFFPNQEIVWMWGHEHRMAIYDKFSLPAGGNLKAYGRCVGHGGMPVDPSSPVGKKPFRLSKAPLAFYDPATHTIGDNSIVGRNGYVLMTLDGCTMTFDYRDQNGESMFVERFVGATNGGISYSYDEPPRDGLMKTS